MIDLLPEFFINEPRRLDALGRGLVWLGCAILMLGAVGNVAVAGQAAILSMGGHHAPVPSLADIYPTLPTWFVPESLVGCLPALMLIAIGWGACALGGQLRKFL